MSPRRPAPVGTPPEPTEAELEILRVLWQQGDCTVRQVHEVLAHENPVAYTTVLTTLQIMHQKGLVKRDESARAHIYAASLSQRRAQKRFLGKLLHRVFEGSAAELVMQALGSGKPATPEELAMIRARLKELEEQQR
ncbi:MAG TPA: BlaI/MecI/CopY family transcriptional regulator [Gammaproteobacteria bacterium]|nr:BlaI/MecI/CopY family transcriptional regulator [Gammaproteobacteria bacterium]